LFSHIKTGLQVMFNMFSVTTV